MIKKLSLLMLCIAVAFGSLAQKGRPATQGVYRPSVKTTTIDSSDIQYWIGSGSSYAILVVSWTPTGNPNYAWGFRWDPTADPDMTGADMMDSIQAHDSRLDIYGHTSGFVTEIEYNDDTYSLSGADVDPSGYWMYAANNTMAPVGINGWELQSGDVLEWAFTTNWSNMFPPIVVTPASDPNASTTLPTDATIAESDILYWVGTGSNAVRFIVSYAQPDTALAWGYRFDGASVTAQTVMDAISAADPRLTITGNPSYTGDITFAASNGQTWALSPVGSMGYNFWYTIKNGTSAMSGTGEVLVNGDYFKFGDMNSAECADANPGAYCIESVWPTIPAPVPAPSIVAQESDIADADILYWVGTGSNSARFIANWADPDTALAWGYRFSTDSVSVSQMIIDIVAADPRLTMSDAGSFVLDLIYTDGATTLQGVDDSYWMYNVNGEYAPDYMSNIYLHNGDMAKFGDMEAATVLTWDYGYPATFVWEHAVTPVSVPSIVTPEPEEATIAEEDILFWVGRGTHNITFIVNWADTALAWGYKTYSDSVSVEEIMNQIMINDPRFSYIANGGFVNNILFAENGDTLGVTPGSYWSYNVNGSMAQNLYVDQYVRNHDMVKWGDQSVATVLDSADMGYGWFPTEQVWEMTVNPVSPAEPEHGPFCGAVGTEGCTAVAANSSAFVGWASTCVVERGYQDIAVQGPRVSYGEDADAVGACDTVDNLSVVSLGDGGQATLTFEGVIYNGEGADFAVFENSFDNSFLELAFVEVSSDGEHFVRFPATSLTQTIIQVGAIGTIDPTMINNLAGKYRHGWGTPFDLDELRDSANLDINHITHVRIVDVVGSINPDYATYDAFGNMVNDPYPTNGYSSGFDLDGVGVMHLANGGENSIDEAVAEISMYPNPAAQMTTIRFGNGEEFVATVYDLAGRVLMQQKGSNAIRLNLSALDNGVYMVRIADQVQKLVVRH